MKALGLVVSEKKIFFMFSHCKSMGGNDPRGGAIFDPRGMIGRVYIEDHYTLLRTKYESFGSCGFGEEDFYAPNFEKVGRAYCFWLVCVSVCLSVCLSVCVCASVNF